MNYGMGVAVLGAMRGDGKLATLEVRGATDELAMLAFIREILTPVLEKGDVVVMDNLTSHKTQRVQKAFAGLGVKFLYLPPYSPDLNPIEICWSKFKAILRQMAARRYDEEAVVAVSGDVDTDLDLYVYDEYGNLIASDDDYSDDCVVRFYPKWSGNFTVRITNRGGIANRYAIGTN